MSDLSQRVTIVVTSFNRRDDLEVCLRSAIAQQGSPRVLAIDNGSNDGSGAMIREKFPQVELKEIAVNEPLIVIRNKAADWVQTPLIVSIDDDAEFTATDIVAETAKLFDDERVGVVAIPYEDVKVDPGKVRQKKPDSAGQFATSSFTGTAYAMRREIFKDVGGYRDFLVRQGEERDFTLRMFRRGYLALLGDSAIIKHYASPRRNFREIDIYGRRNDVLFIWFFCPMPEMLWHLPGVLAKGVLHGLKKKRLGNNLTGTFKGLADIWRYRGLREPVSRRLYAIYRRLRTEAVPAEELEAVIKDEPKARV
ncbi:MAG: glycosyltransferase [Sumerlaeia bacterium]